MANTLPTSTALQSVERYDSIGVSEIVSIYQIQRVLLGDRFDFSVVCQLGFVLDISVEDLTHPNLTEQQINQEQASHYIKGKPTIGWYALDSDIAPRLEKLAYDTYNGTYGRPSRLFIFLFSIAFC